MEQATEKSKQVVKSRTISGPNPKYGLKANEFVRIAFVQGKEIVYSKQVRKIKRGKTNR